MRFLRGISPLRNPNYAPLANWEYAYARIAGPKSRRLRAISCQLAHEPRDLNRFKLRAVHSQIFVAP
jgi:hypothetical protein